MDIVDLDLSELNSELNITAYDIYNILQSKNTQCAIVIVSTDTGKITIDATTSKLRRIASELAELLENLSSKAIEEETISLEEIDNKLSDFAEQRGLKLYRLLEYDVAYLLVKK